MPLLSTVCCYTFVFIAGVTLTNYCILSKIPKLRRRTKASILVIELQTEIQPVYNITLYPLIYILYVYGYIIITLPASDEAANVAAC